MRSWLWLWSVSHWWLVTSRRAVPRKSILWWRCATSEKKMNGVIQDVRYALRQLRRNPGFTVVAVLTLTLGIGANTGIFSVVQAVVLAPLRFFEPDRLVMIWENNPRFPRVWDSYPN